MAFIPEDGTGLPNANSYCEVEFADGYFMDRNVSAWSNLSTVQKESALIAATDYIDFRWGPHFCGKEETSNQALEFPRTEFVGLPTVLKKATAEYALRASSAPLAPDPAQDPSGYQVSRRFEKVGPIEERTDYAFLGPGAVRQLLKPYPAADLLLKKLLCGTSGGRVIRN